ncbi:putative F1F0 ATP synthase assembly protein Atp10, partial [Xylona heveae TC161]
MSSSNLGLRMIKSTGAIMFSSRRTLTRCSIADPVPYLFCQCRGLRTSADRSTAGAPNAPGGKKDGEFVPAPLGRPIGLSAKPEAGQNTGIDNRTWRQKREDFVNYDKHLERREKLTKQVAKPYFREWSNMRYSKGKSFISNPRLFRADKALYFPNFHGTTLASPKQAMDTTPVLENKVSIISVFSGTWAERQTSSFISENDNPELQEVLKDGAGIAQNVYINVEENALKAGLIHIFMSGIRKQLPEDAHRRYFLVRRGLTDDIRDSIGLLNSKVGYVYLVDSDCKIRWAGSGVGDAEEKEGLAKGVRRLIDEWRKKSQSGSEKNTPIVEEIEEKAAATAA